MLSVRVESSSVLVFFAEARALAGFFFSSVFSMFADASSLVVFFALARALDGFFSSDSALGTFFFLSTLASDTLNCPIELVRPETLSSSLSFTECSESDSSNTRIFSVDNSIPRKSHASPASKLYCFDNILTSSNDINLHKFSILTIAGAIKFSVLEEISLLMEAESEDI